jgi:hypothetical protein
MLGVEIWRGGTAGWRARNVVPNIFALNNVGAIRESPRHLISMAWAYPSPAQTLARCPAARWLM